MADILGEIMARRSIRKYTAEEIPEELLSKIIDAGMLGASSRNIRPVELIAVKDNETLEKLSRSRQIGSPQVRDSFCTVVVIADGDKSDVWIEDAVIALDNMHLEASALGIGSCWIQVRNRKAGEEQMTEDYIKELLEIPDRYCVEGMLTLGMPSESKEAYSREDVNRAKIHFERF